MFKSKVALTIPALLLTFYIPVFLKERFGGYRFEDMEQENHS